MKTSFITHAPQTSAPSPVVFSNPHSGRVLPDHFKFDAPPEILDVLQDRHMETLLADIPARGMPVLEALIHRACIDLNRFEDELDPKDISGHWPHPARITPKVDNGQGLFPRAVTKGVLTRIFNFHSRPSAAEIEKRIALYHRPFYTELKSLLKTAHDAHGFCVHIDMHSMRRIDPAIDVIIGTLKGMSCDKNLEDFAVGFFERHGLRTARNIYYSGGALVKTTHAPGEGRHSIQIEFSRDLYMDTETLAINEEKNLRIRGIITLFAKELEQFALTHAAALKPSSSNTPAQQALSAPST